MVMVLRTKKPHKTWKNCWRPGYHCRLSR